MIFIAHEEIEPLLQISEPGISVAAKGAKDIFLVSIFVYFKNMLSAKPTLATASIETKPT